LVIDGYREADPMKTQHSMNTSTAKWVAELTRVREVSLLGAANLTYWKERLAKEKLTPLECDGRAQILIVAADARFRGISLQELSFSILVSDCESGINRHDAFLVQAFNSRRLFAFCERSFFATPYYYGDVGVSASVPASIQLVNAGKLLFRAEMKSGAATARHRNPSSCGEDGWEGSVFLPANRHRYARQGKMFFARIRGYTKKYPFLDSTDSCSIRPSGNAILEALIASQFVAAEWIIREDSTHAKSKTYTRTGLFAGVT
jgi:hypothetical protein